MSGPEQELQQLSDSGLLRTLRPLDSPSGPQVTRDGLPLWNFASNDYLGLANDPRLVAAFQEGLSLYGAGSAASRLITGTLPPHEHFEQQLAAAKLSEAALLFASGFATAIGVIPALVGKDDHVIVDKLSHASLIDGARLSGATLRVFPHNDVRRLGELLEKIRSKSTGRILILTESVFSMDGDLCPLSEIVELKDRFGAVLLLDEAHGFGILGPTGMGLAEELGLQDRIDFHMGTLSKAAGLSGAYIACSASWRDLLINRARSFIYSTAPPPALAHAASASLEIIQSGAELRNRLQENIRLLDTDAITPIIPKILGENEQVLAASTHLEEAGFLVPAIRYPTVPRGTARLRVSLSAAHPASAVSSLSEALHQLP
ncbi:aminotransferase class I/II-fold pyridoxal phosphate-dependent enzyme [Haloferula sp.]|uniref:aminotransferase class I/II-fold pyridoxal phosphate-dependent enzyme n=1 Tax=Haloferula sp. TaxID=2497595 RepID=UPI0032A05300